MEVKTWQMAIIIIAVVLVFLFLILTQKEESAYILHTSLEITADKVVSDETAYNDALERNNPYDCADISEFSLRVDCVNRLAVYDPRACELLNIGGISDLEILCYKNLLNYTKLIKTCDDFASSADNGTKTLFGKNSPNCFVITD
jgi:hypothetical protein